jgi:hypothetical protein
VGLEDDERLAQNAAAKAEEEAEAEAAETADVPTLPVPDPELTYAEELGQLESMGFASRSLSLSALQQAGGDVQTAMDWLLAQQCAAEPFAAHAAAYNGDLAALQGQASVDAACKDSHDRTVLYSACRSSRCSAAVVRFLLWSSAGNVRALVRTPSTKARSLPQHAVIAAWEDLLNTGHASDDDGERICSVLAALKEGGADFEMTNAHGYTAIHELALLAPHPASLLIQQALSPEMCVAVPALTDSAPFWMLQCVQGRAYALGEGRSGTTNTFHPHVATAHRLGFVTSPPFDIARRAVCVPGFVALASYQL